MADALSPASICACKQSNNPASVLKLDRQPLWMCSISPRHSASATWASLSSVFCKNDQKKYNFLWLSFRPTNSFLDLLNPKF
jgi:hypothetical protein